MLRSAKGELTTTLTFLAHSVEKICTNENKKRKKHKKTHGKKGTKQNAECEKCTLYGTRNPRGLMQNPVNSSSAIESDFNVNQSLNEHF